MAKYKNKKTTVDGKTFMSIKEAERYIELSRLEKLGLITDLQLQVKYRLIPPQRGTIRNERPCDYYADFVYKIDGETVVEDTKGKKTKDYVIKRKLMKKVYGIEILET